MHGQNHIRFVRNKMQLDFYGFGLPPYVRSRLEMWETTEIKNVFFQQQQNEQPAVQVISLVQEERRDLQGNRQQMMTSVVVVS